MRIYLKKINSRISVTGDASASFWIEHQAEAKMWVTSETVQSLNEWEYN